MTLQSELAQWDTKSIPQISRIYIKHYESSAYVDQLIEMMPDQGLEVGATWLFKHAIDEGDLVGDSLGRSQLTKVFDALGGLKHWGARLHLLQCFEHLPIPSGSVSKAEAFVRACLISETKFVRAWAYTGFHTLASQHRSYRDECRSLMESALDSDEPASVKARVRLLVKKGMWDDG